MWSRISLQHSRNAQSFSWLKGGYAVKRGFSKDSRWRELDASHFPYEEQISELDKAGILRTEGSVWSVLTSRHEDMKSIP